MEIPFPESDLPPEFPRLAHVYKGRGCANCDFTGFHGQVGVYEYLDVNTQMKRLIANNAPEGVLREEAVKMGLVSLFYDAWQKVGEGITTISEVMGKVPYYASVPAATTPGPALSEADSAAATPVGAPRASVLLVGSDPEDANAFQSVLGPQGYRMITSDWAAAYETVCRENPDAIVLNLDQPEADWVGIGKKLQSSLSTVTIPVLLLQSVSDKATQVQRLKEGAIGVLRRPLEPTEILARVDEAFSQAV
jgi:CheY-like chemotaxis protein